MMDISKLFTLIAVSMSGSQGYKKARNSVLILSHSFQCNPDITRNAFEIIGFVEAHRL